MGKGGEFEREISKKLTVWLTGQKKPYMFWRQDGSGSLATIHYENKHLTGDICSLHPDSNFLTDIFSIECKTGYPKTSFWQHFKNINNDNIREFWKQCVNDAYHAKKEPMLIYRKKGRGEIVGLCQCTVAPLENICSMLKPLPTITMRFLLEQLPSITFYNLKDFLEVVKPNDIKQMAQKEM